MSKFTQEDLLNAMGLKVGDKVVVNDASKYVVSTVSTTPYLQHLSDVRLKYPLSWLIDGLEYTVIPQPKYTLTDEDKILVTNIEIVGVHLKDQFVSRNSNGYLHLSVHEKNVLFLNKDFLKCIENNTSVSLYELREIAKK